MTKKRNRDYWKRRFLYEKEQQLQNTAEYEAAMRARLKEVEQVLEQEVDYWLKRCAANQEITIKDARKLLPTIGTRDWHMTLKEFKAKAKAGGFDKELDAEYFRSQLSRLENIDEQLTSLLAQYATAETDKMGKSLSNQYQQTYMHSIYLTQIEKAKLSSSFANVNEYQVKAIVHKPWRGSDFSKRIWKNYTEVLPNELGDALLRGSVLGHSHEQIFKMMRQRLKDVEDFQLHRLIITEMGHVAETATADAYKEEGVEQYQYLATLESHTCDECAHLDEKVFDLKDKVEGLNYPLIHPYCRCTTMPYINGLPNSSERWARNSETGKGGYVDNMTFNEWKKQIEIRYDNEKGQNRINKYEKVVPSIKEMHNMSTKGKPLSVIGRLYNGKLVEYRYYDETGFVDKDLDLTDHGNKKMHMIVPHVHFWVKQFDKKSGKIRLYRKAGKSLTENEIEDLRRWHNNEQD